MTVNTGRTLEQIIMEYSEWKASVGDFTTANALLLCLDAARHKSGDPCAKARWEEVTEARRAVDNFFYPGSADPDGFPAKNDLDGLKKFLDDRIKKLQA